MVSKHVMVFPRTDIMQVLWTVCLNEGNNLLSLKEYTLEHIKWHLNKFSKI